MSLWEDRQPDPKFDNMYKDRALTSPPQKKNTNKAPKRPILTRGYKESREKLQKNSYYSRSCFNCEYYYQASGDKEECCQNPNVIEYDMVVTDNNIYCVNWTQSRRDSSEKSLFKKTGRSILD